MLCYIEIFPITLGTYQRTVPFIFIFQFEGSNAITGSIRSQARNLNISPGRLVIRILFYYFYLNRISKLLKWHLQK